MNKKTVLKNGLTIITNEDIGSQVVTISFYVNAGSNDEPIDKKGMAHFIEHLFFKGTTKRNALEISKSIEGIGGIINAGTFYDYTTYFTTVPKKDYIVGLDVLCDMMINSLFEQKQINLERNVVLEEIKMYQDDPQSFIIDKLRSEITKEYPNRKNIIGTEKTIKSIKRKDILNFIDKYYVAKNMVLVVTGNVDHDSIVRFVSRNYAFKEGNKNIRNKTELNKPKQLNKKFNKDVEQTHIAFGFLGPYLEQNNNEQAIMDVTTTILGGNMSSRFFQKIREELGLVYSISFDNLPLSDVGYITGYAGLSGTNVEQVYKIIVNELENIKNNPIRDEELKLAKKYIEGTTRLYLEHQQNLNMLSAFKEMYELNDDIEDYISKVNAVTKDDILNISKKYLDINNFIFLVLENK